ncbi:hypothetical protein AYO45_05660 [Gammaproteobacteria bacterium SCGC AG-212-F23]|nr:hypothetical protein AYO45_05660 [Gammaproteobacteria bacterium SCGC AG-212-F23]
MELQATNQPIDIADWRRDEEFAQYPEGARDKTLLYCPRPAPYAFLKASHRYLFKLSSPRYPEQFWAEIIAYRLGIQMDVDVPPAFVAYDSITNQSGALIEWFLRPTSLLSSEDYTAGGDYCQQYIPSFDRKKGKQHNFKTVCQIFEDLCKKYPYFHEDWKKYWAKAFLFDALIGNTDRHQDNWGIIEKKNQGILIPLNPSSNEIRISPIFDNGTSMGHEIPPSKFAYYDENDNLMKKYISKGWHHMKWNIDGKQMGHVDMLLKFIEQYPNTREIMLDSLKKVTFETFKKILDDLVAFKVLVKLTAERAEFMLKLLQRRHQHLLVELEK